MSEFENNTVDTEKIRNATKEALERYTDIQQEVHDITLTALKDGRLETERVKKIIQAVSEGATSGASQLGENISDAMQQAFSGLDQALVKAAEASKLAIEEAVGRAGEFSEQELKQSLNDLRALEELFLETIKQTGESASGSAAKIMEDLFNHARHSGTAVGERVTETTQALQNQMHRASTTGFKVGADLAMSTTRQITQIASGILAGIADSLQVSPKKDDKD